VIERILTHLGLQARAPPRVAARGELHRRREGGPVPPAAGRGCACRGSSPVRGHETRAFARCPGGFRVRRRGCGCSVCDRPG